MTFDNDYIRLLLDGDVRYASCESLGIDWPPPEKLSLFGFKFELVRRSQITDEQRAGMTRVIRGAEYKVIA